MTIRYIDFLKDWVSLIEKSTGGIEITASEDEVRAIDASSKVFENVEIIVYQTPEGWSFSSPRPDRPAHILLSQDYTKLRAHVPKCPDREGQEEQIGFLIKTALECTFPFHDTISLHAACVELEGTAVAFSGPSGLGKSTRARAWADHLGARMISGDRPAIRLEGDRAMACGVPWDGKEKLYVNAEYPLRALVEVRRAPFCAVRRLNPEQARKLLLQQCMIPMWDQASAVAAMSVIGRMIRKLPIFRLFCGPDGDAAAYAYDILYRNPNQIKEAEPDMKIKEGFILRNIVGEHIVMPVGENVSKFEGALVLNDMSAYLWELLGKPVSRADLLSYTLDEYDVEPEVAEADLDVFLDTLRQYGILQEDNP